MNVLYTKILKNHEAFAYLLGPNPDQGAIKEQLKKWCMEGNRGGASHFLIVQNIAYHENFPVFIYPPADFKKIAQKYHTNSDYRVVAVYDLKDDRNIF